MELSVMLGWAVARRSLPGFCAKYFAVMISVKLIDLSELVEGFSHMEHTMGNWWWSDTSTNIMLVVFSKWDVWRRHPAFGDKISSRPRLTLEICLISVFLRFRRILGLSSPAAVAKPLQHQPSQTTTYKICLLYTSPSPRDGLLSRMPSSA